ncbi:MAG: ABC transporter ATP-binding protein [Theionarchaea archaeon]|nr:ABC transporter ATP-binding protein [Theionarchaea archaeon]MBU7000364.1 ABC transporter ATP-binding protein [Theionarchaea archaeon]MBU7021206.1 ABC transporter ATP-binding protein [Theionarchaea archaeon]MBU7036079.1 ABC transporter ATP-binding protein [Theionarchaea archaeon]MBU7041771.1 ABC transporter ATP-binding protein [Theionarchaea archaeon]
MTAIEVVDLVKNYGNIEALRGISFMVNKGEIFGLIGPNGAGKTTTLRIVATLLEITSGAVKVFETDVKKEPEQVREKISYLPEEAGAYKNLSGIEYLNFMAQFYADGRDIKEIVETGISISGLGERITDKVNTYSKGMTRKLLVARSLMMNPPLAILDEPTSGLDVINSQDVRNLIKEYARKGCTVLLSSHNMLEIEFLSNRVALIGEGRILDSGTPGELKSRYSAQNLEEVFLEAVSHE